MPLAAADSFHRPKVSSKQVVFPRFLSVGSKTRNRTKFIYNDEWWSGNSASTRTENN